MRAYFVLGIGMIILALIAWWGVSRTPTSSTPLPVVKSPFIPLPPIDTNTPMPFSLSSEFDNGGRIPERYTCDGTRSLSPPLWIEGVPPSAKSLVLIMDDRDVPKELVPEGVFVHWVLYNIPVATNEIPEGGTVGTPGGNGVDALSYIGPCPPPDYEPSTHRYFFKLYALSGTLNFIKAPTAREVEEAITGMTIAEATLIGTYSRK